MPKTRINCPNCRQPIMADITQLFDVGADPSAKQLFMSGGFNQVQCPICGYRGGISTPLVYHDPAKELLLTFVPTEIALPRNEQERIVGGLLNQVITKLPQEKRKAYLLQPQTALTLQGMVERVLEAEGITREMIANQQKRLDLIQRLLTVQGEARLEIIRQEDALVDVEFFAIMSRLIETSAVAGDENGAQQLAALQEDLITTTTFGQQLRAQSQEIEAAMAELQAAGKNLDREKLLDMVVKAANDTRLRAYVRLVRPLMDYAFFQMLSELINRATGSEQEQLVDKREKLLAYVGAVDKQIDAHVKEINQVINQILQSGDIHETMIQVLPAIDEYFMRELGQRLDVARKSGDLGMLSKLQQMVDVIETASEAPPEIRLIEELLDASDEPSRQKLLEMHAEEITPEFLSTLANLTVQVQGGDDPELAKRISDLNRSALRFSMGRNLKGA